MTINELQDRAHEWAKSKGWLNRVVLVPEQCADVVIRIAHYCSLEGINLEDELLKKMDYNNKRPFRHGGKQG